MMGTRQRIPELLAVVLVLTSFAAGCGGFGEDEDAAEQPAADLLVSTPEFSPIPHGETQERTLLVTNVGTAALHIDRVELKEPRGDEGQTFGAIGWDSGPQDIALQPRESHHFVISYTARENGADWGRVVIASNDEAKPFLSAYLEPPAAARILAEPNPVRWQSVPPLQQQEWRGEPRLVEIQNVGNAPLRVSDIYVADRDFFSVTIPQPTTGDGGETQFLPEDDLEGEGWPAEVAPGESFPVRVWFRPVDRLPKRDKLVLESDDVLEPRYEVPLQGNTGTACLTTSIEELVFAEVSVRQTVHRTITLENCSRFEDLEIARIAMNDNAGGVFSIVEETLPDELNDGPLTIPPRQQRAFDVAFSPTELREYRGILVIDSNDPVVGAKEMPVSGVGIDNACPIAMATATAQEEGQPQTSLTVPPLTTIQLDGIQSVDPDGDTSELEYEWSVISRPEDSTQSLAASSSDAMPTFFLDVVGVYEIELKVYDEQGRVSCGEPAILQVEAIPEEDIYVQLVWDTPGDVDETDSTGADLDLHYLHPNGYWNEEPYDIFWSNYTSDWGVEGDRSDDPYLIVDDSDGAGPEVLVHSNLESLIYQVGVYYYSDRDYGTSFATVAIYRHGTLELELEDRELPSTHSFWRAGFIEWPSGTVSSFGRIYNGFPSN